MKQWKTLFAAFLCITSAILILIAAPVTASAAIIVNQAPVPTVTPHPTVTASGIRVNPGIPVNSVSFSSMTLTEKQLLAMINAERAKVGLPALIAYPKLFEVARLKCTDLIVNNYFSHTSPTYGTPFAMMKSFGIAYRRAGENIAYNSSVYACHYAFMNSTGHRNNILNKYYTHIGLGISSNGISTYVVEMFIRK